MGFLSGLYLIDWDKFLSIEGFTIDSNFAFMFCLYAQIFRSDVNWYVLISDLDVVDIYSGDRCMQLRVVPPLYTLAFTPKNFGRAT